MKKVMAHPYIEEASEGDFEEKVIQRSKAVPVLVDFWAPWCGPCQILGPILEGVVRDFEGKVHLVKVNMDENPGLAYRFRIQGIPAVKGFMDGEVRNGFVGTLPESQIREFVGAFVPSLADLLFQKAGDLEKGDPEQALRVYDQALREDPLHGPSRLGRVRVLTGLGRIEEAKRHFDALGGSLSFDPEYSKLKTLLDLGIAREEGCSLSELSRRVEKEPDNLQARWDLAVGLSAEGKYSEALEEFLFILKKDRTFKEDGARRAILQLFDIIGPRSETADAYREKLARILF